MENRCYFGCVKFLNVPTKLLKSVKEIEMINWKSVLSDSEVAELLWLELEGGISDIGPLYRIAEFRRTFEASLEEDV